MSVMATTATVALAVAMVAIMAELVAVAVAMVAVTTTVAAVLVVAVAVAAGTAVVMGTDNNQLKATAEEMTGLWAAVAAW